MQRIPITCSIAFNSGLILKSCVTGFLENLQGNQNLQSSVLGSTPSPKFSLKINSRLSKELPITPTMPPTGQLTTIPGFTPSGAQDVDVPLMDTSLPISITSMLTHQAANRLESKCIDKLPLNTLHEPVDILF